MAYVENNMVTTLSSREQLIANIEHNEKVTIIFGITKNDRKQVMCDRCRADMNEFIKIDECIEFECEYCGKNVKIPESCWNEDIYTFPNEYYSLPKNSINVKAQCLAQAHRKLNDLGVE